MDNPIQHYWGIRLQKVKKALEANNFDVFLADNKDLAKKLAQIAPGNLNKSLFCPGGAEAMGMALKLARLATGRHKTISMWDSFHGAALDTISIGGEATSTGSGLHGQIPQLPLCIRSSPRAGGRPCRPTRWGRLFALRPFRRKNGCRFFGRIQ